MTRRGRAGEQLHLDLLRRGGVRPGAGRPRSSRLVGHDARPELAPYHPVHVTLRLVPFVESFRFGEPPDVVRWAVREQRDRSGMWIVEYSLQDDHLHLLLEALGRDALSRGMQGFKVRIARGLNRALRRHGPVFADRYHAEVIETPRQMRAALVYVLNNRRKHVSARFPERWVDPSSSAAWFDGWSISPDLPSDSDGPSPVAPPRTWLARTGWRRHGLIHPAEVPGPRARARRAA